MIGNLLAFPRGDRDPLRGWSLAILSALEPAPSSSVIETGNRAVSDFIAYLKELVADLSLENRLLKKNMTGAGGDHA